METLKGIVALIGVSVLAFLVYLFAIDIRKDLSTIDTRVETLDGEIYDCVEANSHDNGMTYIRRPNGKRCRIVIPTRRIKIIKELR